MSTCIGKVMRTFGWTPSEEELKDLVNVIDVDGNGDISFNEFVWLMTKWDLDYMTMGGSVHSSADD